MTEPPMPASGDRKTIFITGAGSGIGRATAKLFAERGWFVGLTDVNAEGLAGTQALLPPGRHMSHPFDVRDRESWRTAIGQFADQTGGRMHVLFNNAGVGAGGWFEDVLEDLADKVIDVNLKGVVNGCYAALPLLRKTPGARIVNVASAAGLYGAPKLAVYSATKFAVRGLTEALDLEFARHGIRVTSLAPWFVDTAILDNAASGGANQSLRHNLQSAGVEIYPVDVAAQGVWDAAHGDAVHFYAGRMSKRLGLLSRLFPNLVRKRYARSMGPAGSIS